MSDDRRKTMSDPGNDARTRLRFAFRALRNAAARRCDSQPTRARNGESGAYGDWRCGRRRGHNGGHRYRNSVWWDDGETHYEPVPADLSDVTRLT